MDLTKGYDYIYSCTNCYHNESLTQWTVTLNHSCYRCQNKSELIGIINKEGQSLLLSEATEEEREAIVNKHDGLLNVLRKANKIVSKQSMRDKVYRLEEQIVSLRESVEQYQERFASLNATASKSESLILTLLETKPKAVKTIQTLVETIETNDSELVTVYTSFSRKKIKMLKLLVERNNILLELNDEED